MQDRPRQVPRPTPSGSHRETLPEPDSLEAKIAPAMDTAPPVEHNPVVGAAPPGRWRSWLVYLLTRARARLAGASLVLFGAFLLEGLLLWLFGDVASEVAAGETRSVDEGVFHFLRSFATPGLDEGARLMSAMGAEVVGVLLVALTVYFLMRRRFGAAASLLVVTVGAQLLNNVLKDHFRRTRPTDVAFFIKAQAWSFPSGHAMVSAAFYIFLIYVGWHLLRGVARGIWTGTLTLLVLMIGLSRMYLGAHYLTDVVAGFTAGGAWTGAVILAGQVLATRRPGTGARAVNSPVPSPALMAERQAA